MAIVAAHIDYEDIGAVRFSGLDAAVFNRAIACIHPVPATKRPGGRHLSKLESHRRRAIDVTPFEVGLPLRVVRILKYRVTRVMGIPPLALGEVFGSFDSHDRDPLFAEKDSDLHIEMMVVLLT